MTADPVYKQKKQVFDRELFSIKYLFVFSN
jgi:hypothetical protein